MWDRLFGVQNYRGGKRIQQAEPKIDWGQSTTLTPEILQLNQLRLATVLVGMTHMREQDHVADAWRIGQ